MFSLILAILSIVLVGLLAVATIYYMGGSINTRGPEASAATVIAQGEQIYGAMELRKADGQGPLLTLDALTQEVNGQTYLTSIPVPPPSAYLGTAEPLSTDWTVLAPQKPASSFMLQTKVSREVCHFINRKAHTDGDIHESADPARRIQCYGAQAPFTVLFGHGGALAEDIVTFNTDSVNPADQIPVDPDSGGPVTFEDDLAPTIATTEGTNPSGPSTGPAAPTGGVTPEDFAPTLTAASDPRTAVTPTSLVIYSPVVVEEVATQATYPNTYSVSNDSYCKTQGGTTLCMTIPYPGIEYLPLVLGATRVTNTTTDAVIVLGSIPTINESLGFSTGIPYYDSLISVAGRADAFADAQALQAVNREADFSFYQTYGDGIAPTFPTYPAIPPYNDTSIDITLADMAGFCSPGQALNPGASCLIYTQDVSVFSSFLTATTAGVEIPFTYGLTALTASKPGKFVVIEQ